MSTSGFQDLALRFMEMGSSSASVAHGLASLLDGCKHYVVGISCACRAISKKTTASAGYCRIIAPDGAAPGLAGHLHHRPRITALIPTFLETS